MIFEAYDKRVKWNSTPYIGCLALVLGFEVG